MTDNTHSCVDNGQYITVSMYVIPISIQVWGIASFYFG